jgi:23S rRNA (uracil1939-C5)-methyltransferase
MSKNNRKTPLATRSQINTPVDLDILRLGMNGEGIGSLEGFTLFVPGALPGEKVRAELCSMHKTYGKARLLKILTPSPIRQNPPCPRFGLCGGCQLMHLPYLEQLRYKTEKVRNDLSRVGGLEGIEVRPCLPAKEPLAYRNKIEVPFQRHQGESAFGFYASESHAIVPFSSCPVHCRLGDAAFQCLRKQVLASGIPPYDEAKHNPGLRHVLLRTSETHGETLMALITNGFEVKGIEGLGQGIMSCHPAIKGVVQNSNPVQGNVILGKQTRVLAGQDSIFESIRGFTFSIDSLSFFQINTAQTETLLALVDSLACFSGKERVLDIFSGVGLFSICLSQKAGEIIGIESVDAAVERARLNARINHVRNASFICARAEEAIGDIPGADVVILDPPRKGCDAKLLDALLKLAPKRIIYVSCNPATLARDLRILAHDRYKIDCIQPLDMFPQTAHVETVVGLSSKVLLAPLARK